jgi:glycosyltransferase involved in cell wall biosynthesis
MTIALAIGAVRKLRVILIAPSLRGIGGQGVQADLLMRHWKNDPAIDAYLVPVDPQMPRFLAWTERIRYLRTIVREPFYLFAVWRAIGSADIAHIFSASYWSFLLATVPAWLMARLRGRNTLINYRSGEARNHLDRWRSALPVLRRTDRLVVPSGYLVDVFREFGLEAFVVPNIVDLDQFRYHERRPVRPLLVCTRGFEPYYRVDLVVRAFGLIKREYPGAHLWLVGKGSLEPEIRRLVRSLQLEDIEFVGPVTRDKIGSFYDRADFFINASNLDNMPVSILEAFASGTPVVSTAPDGIRYLVEHGRTGLLCEPEDWRALATNVVRLLQEPDLASRLARSAYEESRRYRWDVVRTQWLNVYRSLYPLPGRPEANVEVLFEEEPTISELK